MSKNKPVIAIYSGNIPSTTFIENLINVLSEDGFKIYLFGKQKKKVSYNENVKLFPTPSDDFKLVFFVIKEFIKLFRGNIKLLRKSLKEIGKKHSTLKKKIINAGFIFPILNHQPDIFHIQWAKTVEQNQEIFSLLNCRIALSLRGAHINYSPLTDKNLKNAYNKYFPDIDGFHAVSDAIGKEAVRYGAEANKIKVIHSAVRDELFTENPRLYNAGKIPEIISVGRHHWKKGYHYAIDAMNILKNDGIKFRYTIIAQGEVPEEIIYLINDYKLDEEIKIINGMQYEDLIKQLTNAHLLLLPSVEEGIANVVLEAMAAGVPVITTDCGGMKEVVKNKYNGYIVPSRNPAATAERIKEFLNSDIKDLREIVKNARATIQDDFSREKQKNDFRNFYNSLMNS